MKQLALTAVLILSTGSPGVADEASPVLYDFTAADAREQWQAVNDGVMGGLSEGRFAITEDAQMRFHGTLSLENNGGFASIRSRPNALGLAPGDTIVVRVRGDGRTYNFNLYIPTRRTAFSYQAKFETKKGEWVDVEIPLEKFQPTWFGRTLEEPQLDPGKVNRLGILLGDKKAGEFELLIDWIRVKQPGSESGLSGVSCEGTYAKHLQGVCIDEEAIYWSFTTKLVKTDRTGTLIEQQPVADHHGDLCCQDGKLYVAVNLGKFNDPEGNADSWVFVYDAATLEELARHEVQEVFHGAGGIGARDGKFYVVGGLPDGVEENYVYEYDDQFQFVARHTIDSGHTHLGIQTAAFAHDRWWFGCYGDPKILLVADADFHMLGRYEFDCSLGIAGLPEERLLVATGNCNSEDGCRGTVHVAVPDQESGLSVEQTE